jgi:glycerophosphoryl diester phosphodiesterase
MKFFWSFLLLSSFVCCVGETFKHPVKCISHQGERFDAPIHSAPAYRLAMERKADLMKIDVQKSPKNFATPR